MKFCCIHALKEAKNKAWESRNISKCKCDHNEYCEYCYPLEFRNGEFWETEEKSIKEKDTPK